MEEEDNDPYASILQVCRPTIPTIIPSSTSTNTIITPLVMRFIDHALDADGTIIPPESIDAYLCPSPENEQSINNNNKNNDDDDNCIIIEGQDRNHNDSLYIQDRDPPTPPCVVSYQILSPPTSMESSPASLHVATDDDDLHVIDSDYYSSHTEHDGLWLSQLKSLATQQRALFLEHAVSVVTQYRASKYRLSLSLCLSQLKSMATQQALSFNHAVYVVSQFRASMYRHSLSPSPSSDSPMKLYPKSRKREHSLKMPKRDFADPIKVVPSKSSSDQRGLASLSKSTGKKCLADPPMKKQKHCNTNFLDIIESIESSMCNIGSGLNELERVSVLDVSDSESELNGGLTADIASSISSATKSTGNLDKSNGLSLFVDANGIRSNVAGQHNLAASTFMATINVAKSKDVGSSKSR